MQPPLYFPKETFMGALERCVPIRTSTFFFPLPSLTQRNAVLTWPTARTEITPNGGTSPWQGRNHSQKDCFLLQDSDTSLTNSSPANSPDVSLSTSLLLRRWLAA